MPAVAAMEFLRFSSLMNLPPSTWSALISLAASQRLYVQGLGRIWKCSVSLPVRFHYCNDAFAQRRHIVPCITHPVLFFLVAGEKCEEAVVLDERSRLFPCRIPLHQLSVSFERFFAQCGMTLRVVNQGAECRGTCRTQSTTC